MVISLSPSFAYTYVTLWPHSRHVRPPSVVVACEWQLEEARELYAGVLKDNKEREAASRRSKRRGEQSVEALFKAGLHHTLNT